LEIVLQRTLLVVAALILPLTSFSPSLDFLPARGRPSRGCEESDAQKPAYDPFHEMFPIHRIFAIAQNNSRENELNPDFVTST
jgi:hypothetical protein